MSAIKDGIKTLFNELDRHSKIVKFESVKAEDNFVVLVRTKFTNGDGWGKTCNEWLQKFVAQTNSKWVVKTTFPKLQRLEYRKIYVCKENSVSSRNQNRSCDAKIDIKVKRITDNTLKKDKLLSCGYNTEIKVIFEHSHDR